MMFAGAVGIFLLVAFFLFPVHWLHATPIGDPASADTAIIMGFGFERHPDGSMAPGAANQANLDFVLNQFPHVETIFAQEGVWVAQCHQSARNCSAGNVTFRRIDFHDDAVDLHSADIAVCSLERMKQFGKEHAILVAHDMQLWRAAENFERAKVEICPQCEIVVPSVPDTPYPKNSDQLRTRHERIYILFDVSARLRDFVLPAAFPATCPMPMPAGE